MVLDQFAGAAARSECAAAVAARAVRGTVATPGALRPCRRELGAPASTALVGAPACFGSGQQPRGALIPMRLRWFPLPGPLNTAGAVISMTHHVECFVVPEKAAKGVLPAVFSCTLCAVRAIP